MKYIARIILFSAVAAAIIGCDESLLKGGMTSGAADSQPTPEWPFAPVAMRVHPFTQIAVDDQTGEPMLEARIELLDQLGDVTKGVGRLRFELLTASDRASASQAAEHRIEKWEVSMVTLGENRQHYDHITRTYRFKLKLTQPPEAGTPLRLVAQFTKPTGKRLSADMPLNAPKLDLTSAGPDL